MCGRVPTETGNPGHEHDDGKILTKSHEIVVLSMAFY